jgi:hypothetical protein
LIFGISPNTIGVKSIGSNRLRANGSIAAWRRHLVLVGLLEGGEFKASYRLHRHQVGPGAGPAARQCGAVEVDQQAGIGRVA